MIKKSIAITEQQNAWVKAQLASGSYGNESEVFRDLIRERQAREQETAEEIAQIRALLAEAEARGFTSLSKEGMRRKFKRDLGLNGAL